MNFNLFFNSIMLGIGLAMDAFSVSLANGLNEAKMKRTKMCAVSGIFALFQFAMPMIGFICVSTIAQCFTAFEKLIPYIALILLTFIGGKMMYDGIKNKDGCDEPMPVGLTGLLIQGVATSIDALSVGFTIADYSITQAILSCLIIGIVTFFICFIGIEIGKKAGTKLAGKAGIFGSLILIFIGIEIFVKSFI